MRTLGVIPARGGSKGIPGKNLAPLAGLPLLQYTIRASQGSRHLTRTILSSDDPEILSVGRALGVEVPFVRPKELATDTASSVTVVLHALKFVEETEAGRYDFVCLLQPTCPLRTASDIDNAIEMLAQSDADAVVSLSRVEEPHPMKMMLVSDQVIHPLFPDKWHEHLRRQELPPVFSLNGGIYCVRRETLLDHNSLWGKKTLAYTMPADRSINIDSIHDLKTAEAIISERTVTAND